METTTITWGEWRTDRPNHLPAPAQIEDADGIHLVGDINELLGYCDCCSVYWPDIIRWREGTIT